MFCRTCEETKNLTLINSITGLHDLLNSLIGIDLNPMYPMICWKCVTRIQDFNDFREKCLAVDSKLESPAQEITLKSETYYEVEIVEDDSAEATTIELSGVEESENGLRHLCKICGRNYVSKRNLKRHQKNRHSSVLPYEICAQCGINVPRTQIAVHTANHLKVHTYTCDICAATFHHKEPLRAHMLNHIIHRGYYCDKCPKQFKTISTLNEHKKIHNFNRLMQCDRCDKRFLSKKGLLGHKSRHHEEDGKKIAYTCEFCGQQCSTSSALACHKRKHTDERPYKCNQCEMKFRQLVSLRKHQHTHSGTRPFNCPVEGCKTGYYCTAYLKNHMQKIHGMEYKAKPRFKHDQYGLVKENEIEKK